MNESVGSVSSLFASWHGREVYLLDLPGNSGDGLIHRGFRQLARRHRLTVTEVTPAVCPTDGGVLLIQGGGILASHYTDLTDVLPMLMNRFLHVVLLPCSIDVSVGRVRRLLQVLRQHDHCTIICREGESFAAVSELVAGDIQVKIDHDLAFSADFSPWQRQGHGHLHAFRLDSESVLMPVPGDNFDVSALGDSSDDVLLMDLLAGYAVVRTNRAHMAIGAALTGRQVEMFPNSYHKVKGIYDYSLAAMENVVYHEEFSSLSDWCATHPEEIAIGCRRREASLRLLQHPPRSEALLCKHPPW